MDNIVTEKKCNKCLRTKIIKEFPKVGAVCKSCVYEYQKKWQVDNPEKRKATYKKYQDNHPDKMKTKGKKKYSLHKSEIKEAIKKWRIENVEKLKETARLWRQRNTKKIALYNRRQRERFPEKVRLNNEKRRAREKGALGTITAKEWKELLDKYEHKCLCCRRNDVKLTLDHVLPLALGGTHTIDNAQCLCSRCNSKKGARYIDYR